VGVPKSRVNLLAAKSRPVWVRGASTRVLETWRETQMRMFDPNMVRKAASRAVVRQQVRRWRF
jgi:hypothetical protein